MMPIILNRAGFRSCLVGLLVIGSMAPAVAANPPFTPFQVVGHIQKLVLATAGPNFLAGPANGATLTVNGVDIMIPANTVFVMPAAYRTPVQLFNDNPGTKINTTTGKAQSGLALDDIPKPVAAFEAQVAGNVICGGVVTGCQYVAGLVRLSQQSLNVGVGYIEAIDLATGELRVGPNPDGTVGPTDARVHINDPLPTGETTGRYGLSNAQQFPIASVTPANRRFPDPRFQVDQDNPTVHAETGYPMCVPRNVATDSECPVINRPPDPANPGHFLTTFVTSGPNLPPPSAGLGPIVTCASGCDATRQAPFEVGDYIAYQGTLAMESNPAAAGTDVPYISAHTIVAHLGIYTGQSDPVYATLDPVRIGTRGNIVACGTTIECADRIKVEGFSTSPTSASGSAINANVYAVDEGPVGTKFLRLLGFGRFKPLPFGRFRFITQANAGILFDNTATLRGATRELGVRMGPAVAQASIVGARIPLASLPKVANGLEAGQYIAPIGEYIFAEPLGIGGALPTNNFQCLAFLANGWTPGTVGIGPLIPFPSPPAFSCTL